MEFEILRVVEFWQNLTSWGMATEAPTPNQIVILESQPDGSYKDTTATRDGTIDMILALNCDDGRL